MGRANGALPFFSLKSLCSAPVFVHIHHKINPGICGCDVADTDSDLDGTPDSNQKINVGNP